MWTRWFDAYEQNEIFLIFSHPESMSDERPYNDRRRTTVHITREHEIIELIRQMALQQGEILSLLGMHVKKRRTGTFLRWNVQVATDIILEDRVLEFQIGVSILFRSIVEMKFFDRGSQFKQTFRTSAS
jgi:hypothetical protein